MKGDQKDSIDQPIGAGKIMVQDFGVLGAADMWERTMINYVSGRQNILLDCFV